MQISSKTLYIPNEGEDALPSEQYSLAMITAKIFFLKGILEICIRLGVEATLDVPNDRAGFAKLDVELRLEDELAGYLGLVDKKVLKSWKLSDAVCAAEIS